MCSGKQQVFAPSRLCQQTPAVTSLLPPARCREPVDQNMEEEQKVSGGQCGSVDRADARPWVRFPAPYHTGMGVHHLEGRGRRVKASRGYRRNWRPPLAGGDPVATKVLSGISTGALV